MVGHIQRRLVSLLSECHTPAVRHSQQAGVCWWHQKVLLLAREGRLGFPQPQPSGLTSCLWSGLPLHALHTIPSASHSKGEYIHHGLSYNCRQEQVSLVQSQFNNGYIRHLITKIVINNIFKDHALRKSNLASLHYDQNIINICINLYLDVKYDNIKTAEVK